MANFIARLKKSHRRDERGDALMESVVGAFLVGLTVAVIFGAIGASTAAMGDVTNSGAATRAANVQIEELKTMGTCKAFTNAVSKFKDNNTDKRFNVVMEGAACTPGGTASVRVYSKEKVTGSKLANRVVVFPMGA